MNIILDLVLISTPRISNPFIKGSNISVTLTLLHNLRSGAFGNYQFCSPVPRCHGLGLLAAACSQNPPGLLKCVLVYISFFSFKTHGLAQEAGYTMYESAPFDVNPFGDKEFHIPSTHISMTRFTWKDSNSTFSGQSKSN